MEAASSIGNDKRSDLANVVRMHIHTIESMMGLGLIVVAVITLRIIVCIVKLSFLAKCIVALEESIIDRGSISLWLRPHRPLHHHIHHHMDR